MRDEEISGYSLLAPGTKNNMSKTVQITSFILLLAVAFMVFAPAYVSAVPLVSCGKTDFTTNPPSVPDPCTTCDFFTLADTIIKFLLFSVAMPLAVIALLWGGFLLMTSGDNESKRTEGKRYITYAVIGIVVAFAGWIIVDTILTSLVTDSTVWLVSNSWKSFPTCP